YGREVMFDWDAFLVRLGAYPTHFHRIQQPCPDERMEEMEKDLGKPPSIVIEMLKRFNGAKLFCSPNPFVSFFRISTGPPLPPLEWAAEWCIDKFTAQWRAAGSNRQGDWAIAMTNYGGLILLDDRESVKEWDTGQNSWLSHNLPFGEWVDKVMKEG